MRSTKFCSICQKNLTQEHFYDSEWINSQNCVYCKLCRKQKANQYRKKNKDYLNSKKREYRHVNYHRTWAIATRAHHKERGCKLHFTNQDLVDLAEKTTNCAYCGEPFDWHNNKICSNSPTLERINNDLELRLDNIKIVCHFCNRSKKQKALLEFILYCKMISELDI